MTKKDITLKKYVDVRFDALDKKYESKLQDADKALILSRNVIEKRLEMLNEFRESLNDQITNYVPRSEYILQHERVIEDIKVLRESKANLEGKASMSAVYLSYLLAALALLLAILRFFIK